jgi:hypothetical protein
MGLLISESSYRRMIQGEFYTLTYDDLFRASFAEERFFVFPEAFVVLVDGLEANNGSIGLLSWEIPHRYKVGKTYD